MHLDGIFGMNDQSDKRKLSRELRVTEGKENAYDQVPFRLSFESDWSRGKREFSGPITTY